MRNPNFMKSTLAVVWVCVIAVVLSACSGDTEEPATAKAPPPPKSELPAILLVTLDTTRADSTGIETGRVETPNLDALAAAGIYFKQAYSVTPTTLPSHTSMLTGLYPARHGIRENGRRVDNQLDLLAVLLKQRGYETSAFVSGFPLDGQFGLERGFDHYDDEFDGDATERDAAATTDRALAWLEGKAGPLFMWVHYYDPHEPYEPPEPFLSRYPEDPYLGEIAYMDREMGRLVTAFETQFQGRPLKIIVAGDHGEGLGDHGETLHGNLLYQGTMRVPLVIAGSDIATGTREQAVSIKQVFDTVLGWTGEIRPDSLLGDDSKPVLGEALKPYLQYGWQPQFMAVQDGIKVIRSGDTEIYNVLTDPAETDNLDGKVEPGPALWDAIDEYATRALAKPQQTQQTLSQEALDKLASLGYVGSSGSATVREDAPNPKDMTYLFHDMDIGAGLFIRRDYAAAIPVFKRILAADPYNFMAALRLAVAYSVTDDPVEAQAYFDRARAIDPSSVDLRHYQAMHYMKNKQWDLAGPLFESVLAEMPDRLQDLEGLAQVYTRQGQINQALDLLQKIVVIKESPALEWVRIGQLRMSLRDTKGAISAFETAHKMLGDKFTFNLELGMLYMADKRLKDAAASLDAVSRFHPAYPMALFKRAQVSVLLKEADREQRVRQAWVHADNTTRPLIENERLFQGIPYR